MLGKLSVLLVLCQIVAFTYGGVLPPAQASEETCSEMYVNCSTNQDCCFPFRCLDFGDGGQCLYGTDNPSIKKVGNAIQPPVDLINNLGCSLFGQTCESSDDCCAPFECVGLGAADGKAECQDPDVDPYGLGGYGGYGGYPGYPGK